MREKQKPMTKRSESRRYILISPVKDEASHIEETIRSVIGQTIRPAKWIVVDDGSTDETPQLLRKYTEEHGWIQVYRIERNAERQPGTAVIRAFNHGYERIGDIEYDFLAKLDCDLRFERDYFEKLIQRFESHDRLGIASGIYLEDKSGTWVAVEMPDYHAAGASKFMRRKCFEDIGGFLPSRGWDTVDEIKAYGKGWESCHFKDVCFYHLKREGSGIGHLKTNVMHGEIFYLTGGSRLFFLLKVLHRFVTGTPPVVGGLCMLAGYLRPALTGKKLLVSDEEARLYKRLLLKRLIPV